jgi:hypothetical protein
MLREDCQDAGAHPFIDQSQSYAFIEKIQSELEKLRCDIDDIDQNCRDALHQPFSFEGEWFLSIVMIFEKERDKQEGYDDSRSNQQELMGRSPWIEVEKLPEAASSRENHKSNSVGGVKGRHYSASSKDTTDKARG